MLDVQLTLPTAHRLSFSLKEGDTLGISGPSGVGKSLLLRAISNLDCHNGKISLHGADIHQYSAHTWRQKVMLVPASVVWWLPTISAHIIGDPSTMMNQLALPQSLLEQMPKSLSSGEQQRFALIRALTHQPEILLLDEPTSQLDHDSSLLVEQCVRQWPSVKACIWVSHDLAQLDRVSTQRLELLPQ